jgi:hypothetical protein
MMGTITNTNPFLRPSQLFHVLERPSTFAQIANKLPSGFKATDVKEKTAKDQSDKNQLKSVLNNVVKNVDALTIRHTHKLMKLESQRIVKHVSCSKKCFLQTHQVIDELLNVFHLRSLFE